MERGSFRPEFGVPLLLVLLSGAAQGTVIHRGEEAPTVVPCELDGDCPPGLACVSDEAGGMDEPTTGSCLPRLCEEDGHCEEDTVCLPIPSGCEDGTTPCDPQHVCGPQWLAPCETDADCGHPRIRCMEKMSCTNGGAPSEGEDGETVEADCEPLGEFHCEFDILLCDADADCPQGWRCFQTVGDGVNVNYEVPCPPDHRDGEGDQCLMERAPEDGSICLPRDYQAYLGWSGGVAPMVEPASDLRPPSPTPSEEAPVETGSVASASPDEAGCRAGAGGPWTPWLSLTLLWLVVSVRLKACSFGGRMCRLAHGANLIPGRK